MAGVIVFFSAYLTVKRHELFKQVSKYREFNDDDDDSGSLQNSADNDSELFNRAVLTKARANGCKEVFEDNSSTDESNYYKRGLRGLKIDIPAENSSSSFVPVKFDSVGSVSSVHNVHSCTSLTCDKCYENPDVDFISTNGHRKFKR